MANPIVTLIVLSLLGMLDTGHLIWKSRKKNKDPLVCPIGEKCNVVLESKWNKILGVKNEALGFLFYAFVMAVAIFLFFNPSEILRNIVLAASAGAFLVSTFLVFIQTRVIKNYCFYCMISALLNLLILLNVLFL